MEVKYIKLEIPKKNNCFEVEFCFEHGDADTNTNYFISLDMSEEHFINYMKKVDEISKMINESRSTGKSLPRNFEETAKFNGYSIPVELDAYAKMHISNYYAAMSVGEIYYYNDSGVKHKVIISN